MASPAASPPASTQSRSIARSRGTARRTRTCVCIQGRLTPHILEGGRKGGREGGKEGRREGGREGRREGGREGRREGKREGGKEGGKEGGREGERGLPSSQAGPWRPPRACAPPATRSELFTQSQTSVFKANRPSREPGYSSHHIASGKQYPLLPSQDKTTQQVFRTWTLTSKAQIWPWTSSTTH